MTFKRSTCTESDHRQTVLCAKLDDTNNLISALRKGDSFRRLVFQPGQGMPMLFPQGWRLAESVAEPILQLRENRFPAFWRGESRWRCSIWGHYMLLSGRLPGCANVDTTTGAF